MENSQKEKIPEEIMILEKRIRNADLPIISELGSTDITIHDFLLLDVGDVIDLNKAIDEPLTITIGGIPKYSGQPGKVGKKHAIQILDILKGGDEDGK
jgi:flagellar motor switch protein FliM